jgi:hypothetical protein
VTNNIATSIRLYGHIYVSFTLLMFAVFLILKHSAVLAIIFMIASIFVIIKNNVSLKITRIFFGLFSALGIVLFFNGYLLAELDLLYEIDIVSLYFLLYEILFFGNFIICSLLLYEKPAEPSQ